MRKTIVLLVGPKGVGKTYLATRMETELEASFLRVEQIWLELSHELSPGTARFDEVGQSRVLEAVRERLVSHDCVALESTGTAPWFSRQLAELGNLGHLLMVQVRAPLEMCISRIHSRDGSRHIAVSDERIEEINRLAVKIELPWSATVDNVSEEEADGFIERLGSHAGIAKRRNSQ